MWMKRRKSLKRSKCHPRCILAPFFSSTKSIEMRFPVWKSFVWNQFAVDIWQSKYNNQMLNPILNWKMSLLTYIFVDIKKNRNSKRETIKSWPFLDNTHTHTHKYTRLLENRGNWTYFHWRFTTRLRCDYFSSNQFTIRGLPFAALFMILDKLICSARICIAHIQSIAQIHCHTESVYRESNWIVSNFYVAHNIDK